MEFRERLYQLRRAGHLPGGVGPHRRGSPLAGGTEVGGGGRHPGSQQPVRLADYFAVSLDYLVRGNRARNAPAPLPSSRLSSKTTIEAGAMSTAAAALFGLPLGSYQSV